MVFVYLTHCLRPEKFSSKLWVFTIDIHFNISTQQHEVVNDLSSFHPVSQIYLKYTSYCITTQIHFYKHKDNEQSSYSKKTSENTLYYATA